MTGAAVPAAKGRYEEIIAISERLSYPIKILICGTVDLRKFNI